MADIAKLVARLELQSSQFQAELEKTNKKLLGFQRQTNKSLSSIEKQARSFGNAIKGAFVGFGGALAFTSIIRATAGAEQAFSQLEAAVKSTGGVAGFTARQLADMSSDLQRTSTFADDTVQSMQAILLTFTSLRGSEFQGAQQAVLNMATRLGTDLKSAALQVGKALNDPIKGVSALNRAGVQLSKDQTATIKRLQQMGDVAGAQKIILKELETQFGGAAQAARNNFGGALAGLKNAFGDLLEGKTGLNSATESVNALADTLSDPKVKAGFNAVVSGFLSVISVAAKFTATIGNAGAALLEWLEPASKVEAKLNQLALARARLASFEGGFNEKEKEKLRLEIAMLEAEINRRGRGAPGRRRSDADASSGLSPEIIAAGDSATSRLATMNEFGESIKWLEGLEEDRETTEKEIRSAQIARHRDTIADIKEIGDSIEREFGESDAIKKFTENMDMAIEKQAELSVFSEQAARNMQSHFADFLFDPFDKGVKGMVKGFADTIRRMLAEAAAAKVFETLFGGGGKSGGGGSGAGLVGGVGWGALLKTIFGGFLADGGPLKPGKWHIAGEHGPEPVWGGGPGAFAAGYGGIGGMSVNAPLSIDARGATQDAVKELVRSMPDLQRRWSDEVESKIITRIKRRQYNLG